ncbi:MAG: ATP-binding protein [Polyangiaceae bacterium]|nr:ATP-binding protein [Polyangiaceae bacterium]
MSEPTGNADIVRTQDGIELEASTARGARAIFRRFVIVAVGLEILMGTAMLIYDVVDSTVTTRDKLDTTAKVVARATERLRAEEPSLSDEEVVQRISRLLGMPMGLLSPGGTLEYATSSSLIAWMPKVFADRPPRLGNRFVIEPELGEVSGAWVVRSFTGRHQLLIVVPHMPEDEGRLAYFTISGGVLALGLVVSFLTFLYTANWVLRRPLSDLVYRLTNALARDVEGRRRAEQVAVQARMDAEAHLAFLDNLLNAADQVGIVATDREGQIRIYNRAAENILGFSGQDTIGKLSLAELRARTGPTSLQEVPRRALLSLHEGEEFVVDKSGHEHLLAISYSDIVDADGRATGRLLVFLDITERKRLEVELQINEMRLMQSAKLAGLGEMATGVAHELNQPLNNISLLASRLLRRANQQSGPDHEFELDKLTKIQGQVQRASKIIDQLRTFGRPTVKRVTRFPVSRPVHAVLDLLRQQLTNRGIRVEFDVPDSLPEVAADEPQLEQVLINLLNNARDALAERPAEADLWIRIKAETEVMPGETEPRVCLHVADSGPGMDERTLNRIFEPFFTTKEVGKGTGLGLSISYGLVRGFGGTLAVRSRLGEGTTFSLLLPTQMQATEQEQPNDDEAQDPAD